jgi:hypothetical protein
MGNVHVGLARSQRIKAGIACNNRDPRVRQLLIHQTLWDQAEETRQL